MVVERRRARRSRRSRRRWAGLLVVALAIVWGYDGGVAIAAVLAPRPLTFQMLFEPHLPTQPHVYVIPTHVRPRYVLQ